MDYEKAYKAVLQTATQWIKDGCTDKERICLECVFPELRESEDERIRTRLIEYFQGFLKGYEDCYKDGGFVRWEGLDVKSIIAWLEKQKEQKPTDEQFPPLEGLDAIKAKYYDDGFKNGFDEGVESVKPAEWSKNDTVFLNEITDFFENKTVRLQHDIDMYAHWLKSLPERLVLQPKAEWSEEDEQLIGFIFDLLNGLVWRKDWAMSKEECLERLKSLRPSWKPSEEQMMALHYASYGGELSPDELLLLDSLYNQLSELI